MVQLTRRRRLVVITTACAAVFLGVAGFAALRSNQRQSTYKPGEDLEGVTADLARALPEDYPRVTFTDVARQAGIAFRHFSGTRSSQIPEDMGSGAAWGDYDNDGWLDLVVANEVGPLTMSDDERRASPARVTMYHNNGNGTFTDVTIRSGIDQRGWAMGVAWGDYDNDGRIDLVVTSYGVNALYHNEGDGTFTDRSAASRIAGPRGFWTGASWGDYDRDGFLDLFITGYVKYARPDGSVSGHYDIENPASINPSSFRPERNLLFHNDRNGTFTEVAKSAGVMDSAGRGLAATWADFDEDGWPDLYVANDVSDNAFFRNLGNGRFEDLSHAARVADYRSSMGIAVGDWDADGDQDMFLTHWVAQENALYSNLLAQMKRGSVPTLGAPVAFTDEADRQGLGQSSLDFVGWGTSFVDYDNDGKLDLFIVNGSTLQSRDDSTRLVPMKNQLFWNRGAKQGYYDVSAVAGPSFQDLHVGRGAAFGDYDNDGDVDVFVVNHGGAGMLLRNDGGNRNRWIQVQLRGTKSNRQGIGATVRVVARGASDARQVGSQSSYLSQNSLIETFGLGAATKADTIVVSWPSGARDVRVDVPSNQRVIVTEGEAPAVDRAGDRADDRGRVRDFWTLYREATAQRIARRMQSAAESYERALALNPNHEDALYYLGSVRFEIGDFTGAARAWQQLLSVNRSSARTQSQLGVLYMCLEPGAPFDFDSAEHHLRRAHEINKEENGPLLRLGELALLRGDTEGARQSFETVLRTDGTNTAAHFYAGFIAWKSGGATAARSHFGHAASPSVAPVGRAPGEGDTKRGATPLGSADARCGALRGLSRGIAANAGDGEMAARYGALDRLLRRARAR